MASGSLAWPAALLMLSFAALLAQYGLDPFIEGSRVVFCRLFVGIGVGKAQREPAPGDEALMALLGALKLFAPRLGG